MLAGTIHLQVMSDVLEPRIIQQVETSGSVGFEVRASGHRFATWTLEELPVCF